MFHLAPVGLPTSKLNRNDHFLLEQNIAFSVRDIIESSSVQKISYNQSHPDTKALLKSLDAFFSHGLNRSDKCYWCFIREFIPLAEQGELSRKWNCNKARLLSVAWLKDSLNKSSLDLQILALTNLSCEEIKNKWYNKNSCLRNQKILIKIYENIRKLENVQFFIEAPYIFRTEEVSIALPSEIIINPQNSIVSSSTESNNIEIQRSNRRPTRLLSRSYVPSSYTSITSFDRTLTNSHLSALMENLTTVDLPSSVNDPVLSTGRDQNYVIDKLIQSHRNRDNVYIQPKIETIDLKQQTPKFDLADNDECEKEKDFDLNSEAACSLNFNSINNSADLSDYPIDQAAINNQTDSTASSAIGIGDFDLSDIEDSRGGFITGIIPVDSGEIVHLAMEIFCGDNERFQKLFQVYTGHSAGQPLLRYMAVTDQFIYLLTNTKLFSPNTDDSLSAHVASSSFSESAVDATLLALRRSTTANLDHYIVKYIVHSTIALSDIEYISVGIDAQVFCIHLKKHKYLPEASDKNLKNQNKDNQTHQDRRLFAIDSGCKQLTKVIIKTLCQAYTQNVNFLPDKKSLLILPVFTRLTQLSIIIKKLIQKEIPSFNNSEITHHSLIYWIEEQPDNKNISKNIVLEGYLDVRSVNSKSWMRRVGEWQYSYFMLIGIMLYQFSDSTCKFAQRAYNIGKKITQVYEADLKNEDGFIFQLELDKDIEDSSCGSLQFKCNSEFEMKKWMESITRTLSISSDKGIPIACQFIIAESSIFFAQEGANCIVDGFVRSLCMFSVSNILAIFSIKTEFHNAFIIERDNGTLHWIFLRDETELRRLCLTFSTKFNIYVDNNEDTSAKPQTFSHIYKRCTRMSHFGNFWMCNYNNDLFLQKL